MPPIPFVLEPNQLDIAVEIRREGEHLCIVDVPPPTAIRIRNKSINDLPLEILNRNEWLDAWFEGAGKSTTLKEEAVLLVSLTRADFARKATADLNADGSTFKRSMSLRVLSTPEAAIDIIVNVSVTVVRASAPVPLLPLDTPSSGVTEIPNVPISEKEPPPDTPGDGPAEPTSSEPKTQPSPYGESVEGDLLETSALRLVGEPLPAETLGSSPDPTHPSPSAGEPLNPVAILKTVPPETKDNTSKALDDEAAQKEEATVLPISEAVIDEAVNSNPALSLAELHEATPDTPASDTTTPEVLKGVNGTPAHEEILSIDSSTEILALSDKLKKTSATVRRLVGLCIVLSLASFIMFSKLFYDRLHPFLPLEATLVVEDPMQLIYYYPYEGPPKPPEILDEGRTGKRLLNLKIEAVGASNTAQITGQQTLKEPKPRRERINKR